MYCHAPYYNIFMEKWVLKMEEDKTNPPYNAYENTNSVRETNYIMKFKDLERWMFERSNGPKLIDPEQVIIVTVKEVENV